MTERLACLLHDEAAATAVPALPLDGILERGRRGRRRRTRTTAAALVAATCVLALGAGVVLDQRDSRTLLIQDPAAAAPLDALGWAVSAGSTIYLGSGATATLPKAIKSLYYTSEGVVVRTGRSPYSDGPDSSYALVDPEGEVHSLGLSLGDRVPSTDPTLPYLAYADRVGHLGHDSWRLVLRAVATGEEVASIPFSGSFTWGGWVAPPVALDGDSVYVGLDDHTLAIDWRTGEGHVAKGLPKSFMPTVTGGREAVGEWDRPHVVTDATTGAALATLPVFDGMTSLSPDGRWALQVPVRGCTGGTMTTTDSSGRTTTIDQGPEVCTYEDPDTTVVDLDSATPYPIRLTGEAGWTPGDKLIVLDGHTVSLCEPTTVACTPTGITLGEGIVRVGGNSYES
ncbi:MAG: hypothetical protein QM572_07080 [Nocardioides sp.]|uniref:hypothetical protein n=1 Tax=Nocardioides sp. TaxID=35761 RepID=UPI0039E5A4E9